MEEHLEILNRLHACEEGKNWASVQENSEACWNNCKRSDWMIWLIRKLNNINININFYKKYACFCARQNWSKIIDQRSKDGIIAAEQYVEGKITIEEMQAARNTATYAAAVAATYAAVDAAATYAADAAADAAARKQIKIAQCNWIRSQISFAEVMERLK